MPDDTTAPVTAEGLRERYAEAMEDYDSWDHLIDKVVAVHQEHAASQAAEVERLRAELAEAKRENANWREITEIYNEASENWRKRAMPAEAERGALKAAIAQVRADCEAMTAGQHGDDTDHKIWLKGVYAQAKRVLNILAALDAPETPENGDWLKNLADMSLAAAREKFGPTFAPETPGDGPAKHIGGRANAEDCPACRPEIDKTVLYPYICPGEPETPGDAETEDRS